MKMAHQLFLLLLMVTVHDARATFVQKIYKKIEAEQNYTGKIGAELIVTSEIECSVK